MSALGGAEIYIRWNVQLDTSCINKEKCVSDWILLLFRKKWAVKVQAVKMGLWKPVCEPPLVLFYFHACALQICTCIFTRFDNTECRAGIKHGKYPRQLWRVLLQLYSTAVVPTSYIVYRYYLLRVYSCTGRILHPTCTRSSTRSRSRSRSSSMIRVPRYE